MELEQNVWVGDLLIAARDSDSLNDVKKMLAKKFKMKDLGKLKHFLGIDFNQSEREVRMDQNRYISTMNLLILGDIGR